MPGANADEALCLRQLLDAMPSLVLVVDDDVTVIDCNVATAAFLNEGRARILQHRGGEALHCLHSTETPGGCGRAPACRECVIRGSVKAAIAGQKTVRRRMQMELVCGGNTDDLFALVSATPITYQGEQLVLLVIEDMGQVAELQRLVPICVKCGKVRDDDQYWSRVEAYFHRRWDLQFSHGYCPACLQEEMERLDEMGIKPDGGSDVAIGP